MKTKYISPESPKELAEFLDAHDNIEYVSMYPKMLIAFKREYDCTMYNNEPTYNGAKFRLSLGADDGTVTVKFK